MAIWSSIGHKVDSIDAYKAFSDFGLDFEVEVVPAFFKGIKSSVSIIANGSAELGHCGSDYTPVQNTTFIKIIQRHLDKGHLLDTIGSLDEGSKVWALIKLDTGELFDGIQFFALFVNGHDGSTALQLGVLPFRIFCSNQFPVVGKYMFTCKHTKNVESMFSFFDSKLSFVLTQIPKYVDNLKKHSHITATPQEIDKYFRTVLEIKEGKITTRSKNRLADMHKLLTGSTWYDAFNAATNYINFDMGRTDVSKLKSLWFGRNGKLLQKAYERMGNV